MKITLKERRFLIVWCLFNLFALLTHIVPLEGKISTSCDNYPGASCPQYIFAAPVYEPEGGLWPFTGVFYKDAYGIQKHRFNGLFYKYNTTAFVVYILLGIAFVYLPKLWGIDEKPEEKPEQL